MIRHKFGTTFLNRRYETKIFSKKNLKIYFRYDINNYENGIVTESRH